MDLFKSITEPIGSEMEKFKSYFVSLFDTDDADLAPLLDCLKSRNGKMLRPILALLIGKYYGFPSDRIYNVASSLELLHTASLIHDDVVDNSMLRRGNASFNAVFDNKMSILFGDYVVALSLQEMAKTGDSDNVSYMSQLSMMLSSGEIAQLNIRSSLDLSEESYFDIISRKTACLFSCAAHLAARVSGASDADIESFAEFGRLAGLCFQIRDDIFDYTASDNIGKPSGIDMKEGKITLPAIYAMKTSDSDWSDTIRDIRACVATDDQIRTLTEYSIANGGVEYAVTRMREIASQALGLLPEGMPDKLHTAFADYIELVIRRER